MLGMVWRGGVVRRRRAHEELRRLACSGLQCCPLAARAEERMG